MRTKIEWRSASKENYQNFCRKNPDIKLTFDEWKDIIYRFNEAFRNYILETGYKERLPYGFGEFSITKKIRRKKKGLKDEFVNLAVDWKRTKERGKITYNFNYHTEGYFFGWLWFKETARLKGTQFWYFKASRITSRMIAHYINADEKYQHLYQEWKK